MVSNSRLNKVDHVGSGTARIRFGDTRAIDEVIRSAALFGPEYWGTKKGGASKIAAIMIGPMKGPGGAKMQLQY